MLQFFFYVRRLVIAQLLFLSHFGGWGLPVLWAESESTLYCNGSPKEIEGERYYPNLQKVT